MKIPSNARSRVPEHIFVCVSCPASVERLQQRFVSILYIVFVRVSAGRHVSTYIRHKGTSTEISIHHITNQKLKTQRSLWGIAIDSAFPSHPQSESNQRHEKVEISITMDLTGSRWGIISCQRKCLKGEAWIADRTELSGWSVVRGVE